jgi:hypothetical protein
MPALIFGKTYCADKFFATSRVWRVQVGVLLASAAERRAQTEPGVCHIQFGLDDFEGEVAAGLDAADDGGVHVAGGLKIGEQFERVGGR